MNELGEIKELQELCMMEKKQTKKTFINVIKFINKNKLQPQLSENCIKNIKLLRECWKNETVSNIEIYLFQ